MNTKKVPCSLIFFNRPEPLAKSFAAIRDYQPEILFLIQDGARETRRETDSILILQCREIVDHIDWPCEVIKVYSDENLGCGFRIYSGVKEAFEKVDRLVIIEDDIVCSPSFFKFAEEMLERYKEVENIQLVSGMNQIGIYERSPYDYVFTSWGGSIWGWATWKRVWDKVDYNLTWMQGEYERETIFSKCKNKSLYSMLYKSAKRYKKALDSGDALTAWSGPFGFTSFLYSRLNIVPKYNLTSNIGLTADSTHTPDNENMVTNKVRRLFNMKTYNLSFPLKHPKYIIDDQIFTSQQLDYLNTKTFSVQLEYIYRTIRYKGISYIVKKLKKKFKM